ncbi:MAG: hypothetical protein KC464_32825 [Myxococcales bacterium]|nr:hypothetical protein [Myxococcales bacterium]
MSRTIEVFEGASLEVKAGPAAGGLSSAEFDALVRFNDEHERRYFDVGHRRITMKRYVGYLEIGDLAIEILPKADRAASTSAQVWRDGLIEMLRIALGLRLESVRTASQQLTRSSLLDLIAAAYAGELEVLQRHGLAKGYRRHESNGVVFRGSLVINEHLRQNLGRADRFYVAYQTYDHDITVNRLLRAALDVLAACALSAGVAARIASCRGLFPEVSGATVQLEWFDRVHLTRATARYGPALQLARMILEHRGPQLRAGPVRVFSLLFDMSALWERYVAALFRRAAPREVVVSTQERHLFWCPPAHPGRRVRPDIVLRAATTRGPGRTLLVVDTKWKVPRRGIPSDDDLKQMFVYNELLAGARAALLYPAVEGAVALSGTYAQRDHSCEQIHLGLLDATGWSTSSMRLQIARLLAGLIA